MGSLRYDPSYLPWLKPELRPNSASTTEDWPSRRKGWEAIQNRRNANHPEISNVDVSVHKVPVDGGCQSIDVYRVCPYALLESSIPPTAAVLHAHGGGMIVGNVHFTLKRLKKKAAMGNLQLFSVDYRLAPESPHPGPVGDCYAALEWLIAHATQFNVNPARIAVMGDSAGGNLAASVALMARDRALQPALAKQILIHPMLDDRTITPNPDLEKFAIWKHTHNFEAWAAFLGGPDKVASASTDPYAAPARVQSVAGLPPTFIEVGGLDLFRDEAIEYASRIARENIPCELHLYEGVTHSFESIAPDAPVTRRAMKNLEAALTSF